jgi:hypothetical protein
LRRLNVAVFPLVIAQRLFIQINQQHVFHWFVPPMVDRTGRSRIDT